MLCERMSVMPSVGPSGKASTRRYSDQEKSQAVRLVRQLRAELGTDQGAVSRVALQLGIGTESVRAWVRQADIDDGDRTGVTSEDAGQIKALQQENRELRRANEILQAAASFFGAELDRRSKK